MSGFFNKLFRRKQRKEVSHSDFADPFSDMAQTPYRERKKGNFVALGQEADEFPRPELAAKEGRYTPISPAFGSQPPGWEQPSDWEQKSHITGTATEIDADEEQTGRGSNSASADEEQTGKASDSASADEEQTGRGSNSASADEEQTGKASDSASADEEQTGKASDSASADEEQAGKASEPASKKNNGYDGAEEKALPAFGQKGTEAKSSNAASIGPEITVGETLDDSEKLITDTKKISAIGLSLFFLLFGVAGTWASTTKIAGAVIASGTVSVKGSAKAVQHLDGGIVTEILVKKNDLVDKGDILMRLDNTSLLADLTIYGNRLNEELARRSRLEAERDGSSRIIWDSSLLTEMGFRPRLEARQLQEQLFQARRRTLAGQLATLRERLAQFESEAEGTVQLNTSLRKQTDLLRQEHINLQTLHKLGYVGSNQLLAIERQLEEIEGRIASGASRLTQMQQRIQEARLSIEQVTTEFNTEVIAELDETSSEIRDLLENIPVTRDKLERIELRSPVQGTVHQLNVFTIGGVIGAGQVVMEIVPISEELEFEISVAPQFIDQVYVEQPVSVMFPAMNTRQTPKLNGQVASVSPDKLLDENSGLSFYQVKVSVPRSELALLGNKKLVPGMLVEAFLQTEYRTPLNYMLRPLTDNLNRSMREE